MIFNWKPHSVENVFRPTKFTLSDSARSRNPIIIDEVLCRIMSYLEIAANQIRNTHIMNNTYFTVYPISSISENTNKWI